MCVVYSVHMYIYILRVQSILPLMVMLTTMTNRLMILVTREITDVMRSLYYDLTLIFVVNVTEFLLTMHCIIQFSAITCNGTLCIQNRNPVAQISFMTRIKTYILLSFYKV